MATNNSDSGFINPQEVLSQIELGSGAKVADFGCGAGFFSLAIAEKIKEDGIVYSLDVLPQSLESVQSQAKIKGLTNIITKRVNFEKEGGAKIDSGSIDLVVIKDVLFQNKGKDLVLSEANRVLKSGGRLLVIDWKKEQTMIGPSLDLRTSKEEVIEMAEKIGLKFEKDIDAGNFHFGIIFIK